MEVYLFTFKYAPSFTSVTAFTLLFHKIKSLTMHCPSFQLLISKSSDFLIYNANRQVNVHYMLCFYIFLSLIFKTDTLLSCEYVGSQCSKQIFSVDTCSGSTIFPFTLNKVFPDHSRYCREIHFPFCLERNVKKENADGTRSNLNPMIENIALANNAQ